MSATTRVSVKQGAFWVTKGPLPFGGDVLLLLSKRPAAVVSEERLPVTPHEALHALTPPAGVSEAAALEHQRPAGGGGWCYWGSFLFGTLVEIARVSLLGFRHLKLLIHCKRQMDTKKCFYVFINKQIDDWVQNYRGQVCVCRGVGEGALFHRVRVLGEDL